METLNPKSRRDPFGSRINRDQSPLLAYGLPWASILLGSLTPWLPVISAAPVLPPLGLMLMLAWRLLRPGLLPLWAGFPLGLFDDLYSGQPFGSGILLFSLALFVIELVEIRFPWRNFWLDWLTATAIIVPYLAISALVSGAKLTMVQLTVIAPQLLISIMLFPIVARLVALLDRLRLMRVRRIA
ncbi:rod shape-determining protein MreD [Croceibacterium sp. LX-88]|jgi:rod shape-determining protein MreD|uniref:Rod shape-determining protein MreD n=1 Tax=Croceibacterium selenioxidans TaxID=2838833 RepID=A0ABS5W1Y9_9SPHN|nr:rod shape-determining protein MreD [Croceibacterium selenioxidans]MBT2133778.1 rod shape-determining protein MreD [Croceibacterium selenioxidans]